MTFFIVLSLVILAKAGTCLPDEASFGRQVHDVDPTRWTCLPHGASGRQVPFSKGMAEN